MKRIDVLSNDWAKSDNDQRSIKLMIANAFFDVMGHADYQIEVEEMSGNVINEHIRLFKVKATRDHKVDLVQNTKYVQEINFTFDSKNNGLRNIFLDCCGKIKEYNIHLDNKQFVKYHRTEL